MPLVRAPFQPPDRNPCSRAEANSDSFWLRRLIRFDTGPQSGVSSRGMHPLFLFLLLFSGAVGISAQHAQPSNVTPLLLPDLGHPSHPIATKNVEAQRYFDQGLQLAFGFNRAEAVRSFRRASQLDPQAAMPYWGMALAYGRHMNMDQDMDVSPSEAYDAIQQALKLSSTALPNEREYILALAERCAQGGNINWKHRDEAYSASMQHLATHYPDDLDATALSLEARMVLHRYEWFQGTMPEHNTPEIINDIESLLRRAPNHPSCKPPVHPHSRHWPSGNSPGRRLPHWFDRSRPRPSGPHAQPYLFQSGRLRNGCARQ